MNDLKEELKELIEQEENLELLEEVKSILTEKYLDPKMKEWMTERALKAEEDIEAGRVFTLEEVKKKIEEYRKK